MLPLDLSTFEIELDNDIVPRNIYDEDGNRTDRQERDDQGFLVWSTTISVYQGVEKEGEYRLQIHAAIEPVIERTGRHTLVNLIDPMVRIWQSPNGQGCNLHCWGIENAQGSSDSKK